jgi:hypothetical protein
MYLSLISVFSPWWAGMGYVLPFKMAFQCDPPFGGTTVSPKASNARFKLEKRAGMA